MSVYEVTERARRAVLQRFPGARVMRVACVGRA
jgi:hypothetical protein